MTLLGIPGDNTYANYQEANRSFWRQTVLPLVHRTAQAVSRWLGPAWGDGVDLRADLDRIEALSGEREALWARIEGVSFLSLDEKRAAVGYGPAVEGAAFQAKYRPDQPRVPRGNEEGGQWTDEGGGGGATPSSLRRGIRAELGTDDAEPRVRVAQAERPKNFVTLSDEKPRGGHAIERHVGRKDDDLVSTLERSVVRGPFVDFQKKAESTFVSMEDANNFVNRVIERRPDQVARVASGELDEAWVTVRFGYSTGRQAFRTGPDGRIVLRPTYNVGVLIRHDKRISRGFTVITAYPHNEDEK